MSHPTIRRDKRGWCATIKMKPRGYIESNNVQYDVPYQVEEMSHVNEVIEVESISELQDLRCGVEEMDPTNLLTNKGESNNLNGESNNFEGNEGKLEDDFEVYNFGKD